LATLPRILVAVSAPDGSPLELETTTVALRAARPEDRPYVTALSGRVFAELGDYARILGGWFDHAHVNTTLAVVDDEPVGFVMWAFVHGGEDDPSHPVADVIGIAVAPRWRRVGIGALLLGNAIQQARAFASAVDARTIALSVAESNAGARALFERHGFALETDDEARYPNGQRCLRMVTKL
jgi:ribosomal-protein-alanine N-acetyltransferase